MPRAYVNLTDTGSAQTVFASTARTATPTPFDGSNDGFRGVHLIIDVTAVPGAAPTTVFTIQGADPVSGKFYTILASAAIVAVGTTVLRVYPGCIAAANTVANDVLPAAWRVIAVHGNANSMTYTVAANLLP